MSTPETKTAFRSKFFNQRLFVEALKRLRVIGLAVAILTLTVAILVPTVMWLSAADGNPSATVEAQPIEPYLLCLPLFVLPFLAPFFFFVLFSFLHKRTQSDFYHAIPYSRVCVYVSFCTAALTAIFVIQIFSALFSGILYTVCPYWTFNALDLLALTGLSMLSAAFLSSFMMLALALTGTGATTILLFALFASITRVIFALFALAVNGLIIVDSSFYPFLSLYWCLPLRMFVQNSYFYDDSIPTYLELVPYTLIVTLLLFAAAGFYYKVRRSEMAERSAPSTHLQSVFRCLFALPFALLLTTMLLLSQLDTGTVLILFAVVIVVFYLYELITTKRPKNLLKATPWFAAVIAGSLIFVGAYGIFFAVVHRDIPKDSIAAVSVQIDNANSFESLNTAEIMTDNEHMIALVADTLDFTRNASQNGHNSDSSGASFRYHDVTIRLKNGTQLRRTLMFDDNTEKQLSIYLAQIEAYQSYLALPDLETLTDLYVYSDGSSSYYGIRFGSESQIERFWEIFTEEYNALSLEDKIAFKEGTLASPDTADKIPADALGENIELNRYAPFMLKLNVSGIKDGYRYYSSYSIPPAMKNTVSYLIDAVVDSQPGEYRNTAILDENGKHINLNVKNGDSISEISAAIFRDLSDKNENVSYESGYIHLAAYGRHEIKIKTASFESNYRQFFRLISDHLKTRTEPQSNTIPVLIGVNMTNDEDACYASCHICIHLTEEEYNALLSSAFIELK